MTPVIDDTAASTHLPSLLCPRKLILSEVLEVASMTPLAVNLTRASLTVAHAQELRDALEGVYAETRMIIARSRVLVPYRRIGGGSDLDSPFIAEIIARTPMCADCLARKTGIEVARVQDAVTRIGNFMAVAVAASRCDACLNVTTVYRLAGVDGNGDGNGAGHAPAAPKPARPMLVTQAEAIWRFLETRRGQMFCTQCISNALMATKRIDRAILAAEGRGARRQYGPCATCGKERLLCGLTR